MYMQTKLPLSHFATGGMQKVEIGKHLRCCSRFGQVPRSRKTVDVEVSFSVRSCFFTYVPCDPPKTTQDVSIEYDILNLHPGPIRQGFLYRFSDRPITA